MAVPWLQASSIGITGIAFSSTWSDEALTAIHLQPGHYIAGAVAIAVTYLAPRTQDLIRSTPSWWTLGIQPLFLLSLVQLHYASHVPFLYFQF